MLSILLPLRSLLRRCWLAPHMLPLCAFVALASAGASWLGVHALGAGPASMAELREGLMLLAALLHLGLCAPLALVDEARRGTLLLRRARGLGPQLGVRALALLLSTLPLCALVALVGFGGPADAARLALSLSAWVALGLLLGSVLSGATLRAALWTLGALSLARALLLHDGWSTALAWLLPPLPAPGAPSVAAALWIAGALLLADWRLRRALR